MNYTTPQKYLQFDGLGKPSEICTSDTRSYASNKISGCILPPGAHLLFLNAQEPELQRRRGMPVAHGLSLSLVHVCRMTTWIYSKETVWKQTWTHVTELEASHCN